MGNQQSLRIAVQRGDWEDVRIMLNQDENARHRAQSKVYHVKESGVWGTATSLHITCLHSPPVDIVNTLLSIEPGLATSRSEPWGECPVHNAVRCSASSGTSAVSPALRTLIEACPEAVSFVSYAQYGSRTPLHLACSMRAHPKIISILRNADPISALSTRDGDGKTAWEIANAHKGPLSLVWRRKVKAILDIRPFTEPPLSRTAESRSDQPSMPNPAHDDTDGRDESTSGANLLPSFVQTERPEQIPVGEDVCVVCWEGRANYVIVPCGHLCLCTTCASHSIFKGSMDSKCPVCKQPADQTVRVYRSGIQNPGDLKLSW